MNSTALKQTQQRVSQFVLATTAAASLTIHAPAPVNAFPIGDILFRGLQVIQLSNVSDRQEIQLGQQLNSQVQRRFQFYQNPVLNDYVDRVGQRLVASSSRRNIPYTFQIVRDSSINAFATMGGFVYVTTGLLQAADNEAQLASVLGHEIGHIEERHLLSQLRQSTVTRGLASAVGLDNSAVARLGLELAINRPHSRQDELEADQRGLQILRRADYATSAMPEFMQKLLNRSSSSTPRFLSTHPGYPERIAALKRALQSTSNVCTANPQIQSCGLNDSFYQQQVRQRLATLSR